MKINKKNKSLSKNTKLPKTRRRFRSNQRGGMMNLTKGVMKRTINGLNNPNIKGYVAEQIAPLTNINIPKPDTTTAYRPHTYNNNTPFSTSTININKGPSVNIDQNKIVNNAINKPENIKLDV